MWLLGGLAMCWSGTSGALIVRGVMMERLLNQYESPILASYCGPHFLQIVKACPPNSLEQGASESRRRHGHVKRKECRSSHGRALGHFSNKTLFGKGHLESIDDGANIVIGSGSFSGSSCCYRIVFQLLNNLRTPHCILQTRDLPNKTMYQRLNHRTAIVQREIRHPHVARLIGVRQSDASRR